jgi:cytosine/uracil/thiamine/allantoin permease
MKEEIISLQEDVSGSPLYGEDMAPVPVEKRTWGKWDLAALWVGMAVCIPTYLLASYMIRDGLSWFEALIIIGVANLIITIPMVLNGHAGVKYGIPFPVLGRASFGYNGIHLASVVRGIVACGWFGVQTWIGGLAFYAIWHAIMGTQGSAELDLGKFICFGLFWLVNMFFIVKGTESIRVLEEYAAPILIIIGIALIGWGAYQAKGFGVVLEQSKQLEKPAANIYEENGELFLALNPIKDIDGNIKAEEYKLDVPVADSMYSLGWQEIHEEIQHINLAATSTSIEIDKLRDGSKGVSIQFRKADGDGHIVNKSPVTTSYSKSSGSKFMDKLWSYVLWLTAMVGFWATMSLSIADITRYAKTQKEQIAGQFIGLPGTMILYSFVGVFVTCAAVVNFSDILVADDAPWDPVSLLARFENPLVVVIAQIFMIIATLSTNIAANVIAPANAFSNLNPSKISFKTGGIITGVIGIIICPWWLINDISAILIFISGLLGPVLAILLCDYYAIRKTNMKLADLYKLNGIYSYGNGFNQAAMLSLIIGVASALIGYWYEPLDFLYKFSWFTGFAISFLVYWIMMKDHREVSLD